MGSKAKAVAKLDVKDDFPVLKRSVRGKPLVYVDSAATSQKPQQVIDAITEYYGKYNANVHRAVYDLGEEATREYEGAREKIAAFIGAKDSREVVFTRGTTESLNALAYAWGIKGPIVNGDEIVTTIMEHHSNTIPWYFVQDMKGARLKWVDIHDDGTLKMEQYDDLVTDKTKIVTVTHVSNVLGTINPIKEIAKIAHEHGAICVVDGAQSAPHMPVNVADLGCDFYTVSGHKMCGPTGSGVLWGRYELLEKMEPFLGGGEMIREVHKGWAKWNDVPYKFEAGTPNIGGAIGLGAAVDYLTKLGMENVRRHEVEVTEYALEEMHRMKGVVTYGPDDMRVRGGVVSFNVGEVHAHDVASVLNEFGVCVRSGHHCAQPLMERLDVAATSRASFYVYNDLEDVDRLVEAVKKVQEIFA
ncbi:MAG TPA: cysteine desulfurase [Thermoplasmata archaeon]|nr:cysteine desulfurase [Thermoplasmata archaeon]